MKKKIVIALSVVLIVVISVIAVIKLGGFASRPDGTADTMELSEVSGLVIEKGYTQEEIEEKLKGEYRDNILISWGEPDGSLFGMFGDVWFLDTEKDRKITLYYDAEGYVENVRVGSISEKQQGDNNMQYFFGGKVTTVGEGYLILEVVDIGNSNLSEGVKVEVSTDVVAARGCPEFEVDEYAKVLMAHNTDDNPPGRLEALSIYKTDETGSPIDAIHELKNGELEFVVEPGIDTIQMTLDTFKTNTTEIIVTTDSKLGESEVSILLYGIEDSGEQLIGTSMLSSEENHVKIAIPNRTFYKNCENAQKIGLYLGLFVVENA